MCETGRLIATSKYPPSCPTSLQITISNQTIWLIALGLVAVDLIFFMVPIVPFVLAYVLLVRPPWFKDFVDDLYNRP